MNRINMRNEARRFIRIMFGTTCCALAYRCFLSPAGLFNGGFTGIAQIIRNVIQSLTGHTFHSDPTGIIVWCLNVPLMIYGYKELGRMFMIRTIFHDPHDFCHHLSVPAHDVDTDSGKAAGH